MKPTESFKRWLVDRIGLSRSEANELCVSGWPRDVARAERLWAEFVRRDPNREGGRR